MHFQDSLAAVSDYATYITPDDQPREGRLQTIEHWSVVGHDRIVGTVHHRPGQSDGKTIITSPVLQVRLMGVTRAPVAFTESGSTYWLGTPSTSFGMGQAEHFVWFKSRSPSEALTTRPDPNLQTAVGRLSA